MSRPIATSTRAAALLGAVSLLAGCGHVSSPTALAPHYSSPAEAVQAPQAASPAPGAPDNAALARAAVAAVARTKITTRTWTAQCYTETTGPTGASNWNLSRCNFRAPSTMAATVIDAKDQKTLKTQLVYNGGADIDLKTYFFGFLAIKITLPVNDSRLVDANHRTFHDTQTSQLMGVVLDPKAQVTYAGESTVKGEAVDMIDVVSPSSWSDVSHEVVGVSKRLGVPVSRAVYNKSNHRVFYLELQDMRVNYKPGPDDFSL